MPNHDYRPDLMGSAELSPAGPIEAGSWQSYTLTYTAGKFGIDDQGGLKVAFRTHSDMTPLQMDDPKAPGYLTIETSNGAPFEAEFSYKRNLRPWGLCITVLCKQFLKPGDQIIFRIGDQRQGSPGVRTQTHIEAEHQFRITVDAFATVDYTPLEDDAQPFIKIVPGAPKLWKAILPTLRKAGQPFRFVVKPEDNWGNPSDKFEGEITLRPNKPINGLPETVAFKAGEFSVVLDDLTADAEGDYTVDALINGEVVAHSNPMRISASTGFGHYWSDMHGQSGETIGSGSARDYFFFAKHRSFVDITGHQGNDFQISDNFWDEINSLTAEFNEEGKFLALPGYEWSGNTGLGGDHNIWYRNEGRPIYRSSRAIVRDKTRPESDCHDVTELFEALRGEDVLVVPHVGGRFADVTYAHDASVEPSVEVHSSWGTFDWIAQDALKMGYRIGIVAGSDGHKGRPGASYPGDAKFGSYGGLTCHLLPELTRDALFEEFRRRHHYATTGCRLYMSAEMEYDSPARVFVRNPTLDNTEFEESTTAIMGDIVQTDQDKATFNLEVSAQVPIEKVELFDGLEMIDRLRPYGEADLGARYRVTCKGQETRGRQRLVKWTASADLEGGKIRRIRPINFYNPDRQPAQVSDTRVEWVSVTTGGAQSVDLWVEDAGADSKLVIKTNQGDLEIALSDIGLEGTEVACGGIDKTLLVQRMPEELTETQMAVRREVSIPGKGDSAIFARVVLEDGHVAWTSPIYSFK
ncbi:DUF3604 domain-containing protein [Ruegeria sp. Ofav3-42]|uniref:DUF3604 domain-containing protein n=1 Tax=Ruegeria sp. Ofav3-42 TaxID=2917759 RepID=UPI001EF604E4|nr:DUF3604 domain-containing protein [Ruegeria sp. Ofav3-42]MCG7519819.1 DUF3604 domain-containing protein [Ruegeria sp. Ofav3-42]